MDTPPRIFISYARSDGEVFASALRQRLQAEHPSLTLWQDRAQLAAGRESAALQGDVDEVDTVAIAPSGRFAYSVVGDTVVASDLIALKPLRRLSLDHNITAIAVTPDGLHAALGDESGRVHFLTLDAGEPVPRHGGAIGNES